MNEPVVLKHKRTTLERAEKFISEHHFSDINLRSKLYPQKTSLKSISHFKAPGRISVEEALQGYYQEAKIGQSFGPTWSTHWFCLDIEVPESWVGQEVCLLWNSNSEALVWRDGQPIQGLSGEHNRLAFPLIIGPIQKDQCRQRIYIEMACNGLFGAGNNGLIQEPDPNRQFTLAQAELAVFDRRIYNLILDVEILHGMAKHLPDSTERGYQALYAVNKLVNTCNVEDPDTYDKARAIAEKFFKQGNGASQHTLHAMGHCHMDTAWLWPYAETIRKCARSWSCTLRLMEQYPDFTFTCSQAQQFEWVKEHYPGLYDKIKSYVRKGKFLPVGGTWVEMDGNIPSGESFVRQFLYGQLFFEKEFGKTCSEFWLPDTFGYSAQLPQIMTICDIKRFLTQKISWSLVNKFPHHTFWWEGIDGSRVLSHFPPGDDYGMAGQVKEVLYSLSNYRDKGRSGHSVFLFGYGDGGNGPSEDMLQRLQRMQDTDGLPRVKMSSPDEYFSTVEKYDSHNLCKWTGELYLELHNGTYTTHAKIKELNRRCEFLLHDVEWLCSMALVKDTDTPDQYAYPSDELLRIWKLLLLNQFHDVLPGSSIELVYKDSNNHYKDIMKSAQALWTRAVTHHTAGQTDQCPLVVNTLSWEREEVVTMPAIDAGTDAAESSEENPSKKLKKDDYLVQTDVHGSNLAIVSAPSCGYAKLQILECQIPVSLYKNGNNFVLENQYLSVNIDSRGRVVDLRVSGIERNAMDNDELGNQFVIYDDVPLYWDAWDVMDYHLETRKPVTEVIESVKILDQGPIRVSIQFSLKISDRSYLKQMITLDAVTPYLKCETEVTWHENRKFLKVEFPTSIKADKATYDIQFGHLQRSNHFNTSWDWAQFEVCGHKWADLSEYGFGLSILNNSKYGYSCLDHVLRLSLLRSPKAPDVTADMGTHKFTYAIMPHTGTFQEAGVIQQAYNLNCPLYVQQTEGSPGRSPSPATSPESSTSFFQLDTPQVILETVKKCEKRDRSLVLRFYESFGGETKVSFTTGILFKKIYRCNGLEQPFPEEEDDSTGISMDDGVVTFTIKPFQILSFIMDLY